MPAARPRLGISQLGTRDFVDVEEISSKAALKALVTELHTLVLPPGKRDAPRRSPEEAAQLFASLCVDAAARAADAGVRTLMLEEGIASAVLKRAPRAPPRRAAAAPPAARGAAAPQPAC